VSGVRAWLRRASLDQAVEWFPNVFEPVAIHLIGKGRGPLVHVEFLE